MGKRISKLVEKPYTNEIGQVINVGDTVVYVTRGRGQVGIGTGVYEGVNVGPKWYGATKPEDLEYDMSLRVGQIPVHIVTFKKNPNYDPSVRWGTPEYNKHGYYLQDEAGNLVTDRDEWTTRKTTLYNKRIFKIDTTMVELKGRNSL